MNRKAPLKRKRGLSFDQCQECAGNDRNCIVCGGIGVVRKKRGNKYNAVRTSGYDSRAEADYAAVLKLREKAGEIRNLKEQVTFVLFDTPPTITWKADFCYEEHAHWATQTGARVRWVTIVEDLKGVETERFRLISKIWSHLGPHRLRIVKGDAKRGFRVTKEIVPKICT